MTSSEQRANSQSWRKIIHATKNLYFLQFSSAPASKIIFLVQLALEFHQSSASTNLCATHTWAWCLTTEFIKLYCWAAMFKPSLKCPSLFQFPQRWCIVASGIKLETCNRLILKESGWRERERDGGGKDGGGIRRLCMAGYLWQWGVADGDQLLGIQDGIHSQQGLYPAHK